VGSSDGAFAALHVRCVVVGAGDDSDGCLVVEPGAAGHDRHVADQDAVAHHCHAEYVAAVGVSDSPVAVGQLHADPELIHRLPLQVRVGPDGPQPHDDPLSPLFLHVGLNAGDGTNIPGPGCCAGRHQHGRQRLALPPDPGRSVSPAAIRSPGRRGLDGSAEHSRPSGVRAGGSCAVAGCRPSGVRAGGSCAVAGSAEDDRPLPRPLPQPRFKHSRAPLPRSGHGLS